MSPSPSIDSHDEKLKSWAEVGGDRVDASTVVNTFERIGIGDQGLGFVGCLGDEARSRSSFLELRVQGPMGQV